MLRISAVALSLVFAAASSLSAQERIVNGAFNGSIAGWSTEYQTVGYSTAQDHTGGASGSLEGLWIGPQMVNLYTVATQIRPITPNVYYTLSGFIRLNMDSFGLGSTIDIEFQDAAGQYISGRRLGNVSTAGSWQSVSLTSTTPANAASVRIDLLGTWTPGQISWFDDISLVTAGTPITLTVSDASATEGSPVPFTVTRSGPTSSPLTVNYRTFTGTAQGNDFPEQSGSVVIPAGSASTQILVPTTDDTRTESSETFELFVSVHDCAFCDGSFSGTGTIIDNEEPITVTVEDTSVTEGDTATFVVTRTGSTAATTFFNYSVQQGTAQFGTDLNPNFGPITMAIGQASVEIQIPTLEDNAVEGSETFTFKIAGAADGINDIAIGTIIDDDTDGPGSVSINDANANEGNSVFFTLSRTGSTNSAIDVSYSVLSGSATAGTDFNSASSGTITIQSGSSTAQIVISTIEDNTAEPNETFTIRIDSATGGTTIGDATGVGTIVNDDGPSSVQVLTFTANPSTIAPGGSSTLSWTTQGASSVTIAGISGSLPANGSTTVSPALNTTYQLTAHGPQSTTATAQVTVLVSNPNAPVITFTANLTAITAGESVRLSWSVTNATSVVITPAPGTAPLTGSEDVFPATTTRYLLTATGPNGQSSRELQITVTPAASPPPLITLRASPPVITPGESVTLIWNTANAHTVTIDGVTNPANSGSAVIAPQVTTQYTLTAVGNGGTTSRSIIVFVERATLPALDFAVSPQRISPGQPATLKWSAPGATALCSEATTDLSGSMTIRPEATTTYAMRAGNISGIVIRTVSIIVDGLLPPDVETVAGAAGVADHVDGVGSEARFEQPAALARDSDGNIYIADSGNHVIRRMSGDGIVTTFAGAAGVPDYAEGTGIDARFHLTDFGGGVAVDENDNVYVADSGNHVIRRITPGGVVTLFAGAPGVGGWVDGVALEARFFSPSQLVFDASGNLYVADSGNHTIRKIAPDGMVTTYAGFPGAPGFTDERGTGARFNMPHGLAVDRDSNLYVVDSRNDVVRKITPERVVSTLGVPTTVSLCGFQFRERGGAIVMRPGPTSDDPETIVVADPGSHLIVELGANGTRTLFGDGAAGADDNVLRTSFNGPRALLFDGDTLIIADTENHTLRRSSLLPQPTRRNRPLVTASP